MRIGSGGAEGILVEQAYNISPEPVNARLDLLLNDRLT
jgi:hypothetical protein